MEDAALVVKNLRSRRRQAMDTIWRRDLIVALTILLSFIIFLNLTHFGVIPMSDAVWVEVLTFVIFFLTLFLGVGLVHYLSYLKLNESFIEAIEERIENQSGLFLKFGETVSDADKASLGLDQYLRLPNVTKIKKMEVTCIDDYVYLYSVVYGNKEKALIIQTKCEPKEDYLFQLRNDIRVMPHLNADKPIKTYYPENVPELAQFVGFSNQTMGSDGFFDATRKSFASILSGYAQYHFCLTRNEKDVTLMIDGLSFEKGSNLYARLDETSFAHHLAVRSMIQTVVGIVTKTAHEQ